MRLQGMESVIGGVIRFQVAVWHGSVAWCVSNASTRSR